MSDFDYIKYLKEGKLFEESVNEDMSKGEPLVSAIRKQIAIIDKQIDTETGGSGELLTDETLQALEQERERLEKLSAAMREETTNESVKSYAGAWGKEEHEEKREKIDRNDKIRLIKLALGRMGDMMDTEQLDKILLTLLAKERGDTNEEIKEIKSEPSLDPRHDWPSRGKYTSPSS